MSPTQRTLAHLRSQNCDLVQVVEHWNGWAKIRQDLFGFVDVLAVDNGRTYAYQVTSGSNVSARQHKITQDCSIAFRALKEAGWIIRIHGWRKVKVKRGGKAMRWELREVEL